MNPPALMQPTQSLSCTPDETVYSVLSAMICAMRVLASLKSTV